MTPAALRPRRGRPRAHHQPQQLRDAADPLRIGDYAEVGAPCPCGRGLPVLKRIMGRYRNLLTLPDGTRRWPRLGYESSLQDIAPIELMQMIQTGVDEIKVAW
jgi:phenylacetate-coenzyme A ligase PaaK-like adenylate-forming protein